MSLLDKVTTAAKPKALAVLVFSDRGLGKTTFPSTAPNPIYVTAEENDEYDLPRLPKVEKWEQLKDQLRAIRDEKHDFKTLVIDTIDTLEKIAQRDVILTGKNEKLSMEHAHGGFGKAYAIQSKMFNEILIDYLVPIRDNRKMNVVILAHSEKKKHEDPITNLSYDSFTVAMHKTHRPAYENWVSAILFISYDLLKGTRADGKEVVEGLDGKRVIYTEERPAHSGKNRFQLPYEMEYEVDENGKSLAWPVFSGLVKEYYQKQAARTKAMAQVTAETGNKYVADAKTVEAVADKIHAEEEKKTPPPADVEPTEADVAKAENTAMMIELGKKIDNLMDKVPAGVKGNISTSVSRAVTAQDPKEMQRILTKIEKLVKA